MFGLSGSGDNFDPDVDIPDLTGKVILVTGGNSGLGAESLLRLALHSPAHLILAARNPTSSASTIKHIHTYLSQIQPAIPASKIPLITFLQCDLASLASVKAAAKKVMEEEGRLDILMLNAGVMAMPPGLTEDGYEIQFGINHLGHAALVAGLLELLCKTARGEGKACDHVHLENGIGSTNGKAFQAVNGRVTSGANGHSSMDQEKDDKKRRRRSWMFNGSNGSSLPGQEREKEKEDEKKKRRRSWIMTTSVSTNTRHTNGYTNNHASSNGKPKRSTSKAKPTLGNHQGNNSNNTTTTSTSKPDVRIIILTSIGHRRCPKPPLLLSPAALRTPLPQISTWLRYGQSKLANILFAKSLHARLHHLHASYADNITVAAVHPGLVATGLIRGLTEGWPKWEGLVKVGNRIVGGRVEEGVRHQLWAATGRGVVSGGYYEGVGEGERAVVGPVSGEVKGREGLEKLGEGLWRWTGEELGRAGLGFEVGGGGEKVDLEGEEVKREEMEREGTKEVKGLETAAAVVVA